MALICQSIFSLDIQPNLNIRDIFLLRSTWQLILKICTWWFFAYILFCLNKQRRFTVSILELRVQLHAFMLIIYVRNLILEKFSCSKTVHRRRIIRFELMSIKLFFFSNMSTCLSHDVLECKFDANFESKLLRHNTISFFVVCYYYNVKGKF